MRETIELQEGWLFCLTPLDTTELPAEDDKRWINVTVPHDWAIYGEFSPDNDPQPLENSVLDYHEGMIQIGRTGGLPFIGTGWYKRDLSIPENTPYASLEFDGIMNHGEVYINGQKVAERPFGYSSFCVDISDFVQPGENNQLTVRVNSLPATSRWYPGAGLFRPVHLVLAPEEHICYCGVWIGVAYDETVNQAELTIKTEITAGKVLSTVFSPEGHPVASAEGADCHITIDNPELWDVDHPNLYTIMSEVLAGDEVKDRVFTEFGVRKVLFDPDKGFSLNGKHMKIQGVCMHHDYGMLGAAYRADVVKHRLLALKQMGCNALRTTHNPPCPETLTICDRIGMLVLDEAFDEWHTPKTKNGYATLFDAWAETDLRDMIRRDRNHPSVILYSIGNEIPDQIYPKGRETCHRLVGICHREDPYREVTCGFNKPLAAIQNGLTEEVDIVGLNYTAKKYEQYHKKHPKWKILATETMSAVASRDEYFLPAEEEVPPLKHDNLQVNGFDLSAVACAYIQDDEFDAQRAADYVAGQFVWSGYDYLGEGTPYREEWPNRSSYFGIFDLAGLKKNRYYAFAAEWGAEPVLHLFPHWNWKAGELVDVFCYTNIKHVRFWLNQKELQISSRRGPRISLGKIPFEPGKLIAAGYKEENGIFVKCAEDAIETAGNPHSILLTCSSSDLKADGSVIFLEGRIVDENGVLCPNAGNRINIRVSGAGEYNASDAGDATCLRPFNRPYCNAFHGKLAITVQTGKKTGFLMVSATSDGLKGDTLILQLN